jgi:hypothetical protein
VAVEDGEAIEQAARGGNVVRGHLARVSGPR